MSAVQNHRRPLAALAVVAGWFTSPAITCFAWPFRAAANDVRMAAALWRTDVDSVRGRGCALFYLVAGANKIAMAGMGLMAACLFLLLGIGKWFQPPMAIIESFVGFFVAGIIGYGLVGLTSVVAVGYALQHRMRIWIDENPQPELISKGVWPPIANFTENGAHWVAGLPALLAMCPACLLLDHGIVAAYVVGMATGASALLVVRLVVAGHPSECYPELLHVGEN